jgi:hypothetical protein
MILINGVLHVTDADGQSSHFWIPDITIYPRLQRLLTDTGFSDLRFTPFSSLDRWNLFSDQYCIHRDRTNTSTRPQPPLSRSHNNHCHFVIASPRPLSVAIASPQPLS